MQQVEQTGRNYCHRKVPAWVWRGDLVWELCGYMLWPAGVEPQGPERITRGAYHDHPRPPLKFTDACSSGGPSRASQIHFQYGCVSFKNFNLLGGLYWKWTFR